MNSETPIKGVSFDPRPGGGPQKSPTKVWRARLYYGGTGHTLGRYETVREANAALEYHRAVFDVLMVRCGSQKRCMGCKGLRLRSAEDWLTI